MRGRKGSMHHERHRNGLARQPGRHRRHAPRLGAGGPARLRLARRKLLRRPDRAYRLFPHRVRHPPPLAGRACLCRPGRAVPVRTGPGLEPGRLLHRAAPRRLAGRPCRMVRLHPALRRADDGIRLRGRRTHRITRRRRAAARPEAGRGGDRGAGRLGHGAVAVPRPGARFDRRGGAGAGAVRAQLAGPDRRHPAGSAGRSGGVPRRARPGAGRGRPRPCRW